MEEHGAEEGGELDVALAGESDFVDGCARIGMRATDTGELPYTERNFRDARAKS